MNASHFVIEKMGILLAEAEAQIEDLRNRLNTAVAEVERLRGEGE